MSTCNQMPSTALKQLYSTLLKERATSRIISAILVAAVFLPVQAREIDPMPTVEDVIKWLPPDIEELVVAKKPPPPTYRGYLKYSTPIPMELCQLPSMPEDLLKELDLITYKTGAVNRDTSDISGAWTFEVQLDQLLPFSGRHRIELQSQGGKIAGSF